MFSNGYWLLWNRTDKGEQNEMIFLLIIKGLELLPRHGLRYNSSSVISWFWIFCRTTDETFLFKRYYQQQHKYQFYLPTSQETMIYIKKFLAWRTGWAKVRSCISIYCHIRTKMLFYSDNNKWISLLHVSWVNFKTCKHEIIMLRVVCNEIF